MPSTQQIVMSKLYEEDIWAGFSSTRASDLQGWNSLHPLLARMDNKEDKAPIFVDVGVWKGLSTITIAQTMKDNGIDGCVVAVDTFLGSPEHWAGLHGGLHGRKHGMPDLYEIFMTNVVNSNLQDYIVPVPQTSVTAAKILRQRGVQASVVHIDAAHEYEEVLRDAEEYWEVLRPGGLLIGDDYHPSWPGVVQAAGMFTAKKNLELGLDSPKWFARKPS